jgi:acetylornithine deacetylase/succinyl-diaminopimelate desuccinylase-like protein
MPGTPSDRRLTGETIELLQALIRNACVNDGTSDSGEEWRNADVLQTFLEGAGLDVQRFESRPGRASVVARIEGSDPGAPSLCLMGHTDVVPVSPDGWHHDPFGGELIDGEVWGRGAIDMLNLTSSMAVAFRHLARSGFRPRGDLIYFGVADEEAGALWGAEWMFEHHPDVIDADYCLTELGGWSTVDEHGTRHVTVNIGEKGLAWRKLRVHGTPGHGSMPFGSDNALVKAARIVDRLAEYQPKPYISDIWRAQLESLGLPDECCSSLTSTWA